MRTDYAISDFSSLDRGGRAFHGSDLEGSVLTASQEGVQPQILCSWPWCRRVGGIIFWAGPPTWGDAQSFAATANRTGPTSDLDKMITNQRAIGQVPMIPIKYAAETSSELHERANATLAVGRQRDGEQNRFY